MTYSRHALKKQPEAPRRDPQSRHKLSKKVVVDSFDVVVVVVVVFVMRPEVEIKAAH